MDRGRGALRLLLAVAAVMALCMAVSAQEADSGLFDVTPDEGLGEDVTQLIGGYDGQAPDLSGGLSSIVNDALNQSGSSLRQGLGAAAMILAALMLCGLFDLSDRASGVDSLVGALAITAACTGNLHSMITLGGDTLTRLNDYSQFILPSLTGILASSGFTSASAALYAGTAFFLELLMTLIARLLIPALYVYVAVSAAEAAMNTGVLAKLRDLIKWLVTVSLKTVMYVFTGYLSITGILSGSADAAKLRAAKLTLSGTVPVVGSIVSDASETLLSSAAVVKNAVGTYGLLAVLAVCLLPFFRIGLQYLILKATTALGGMVGRKNHVTLVENLSGAMGLLLGMTGAYSFMLLFSIALCMKAVGL